MIICITGLPGAGKSAAGRILGRMGYRVCELGDIVREMMRKQGIRITPESDKHFTIDLRRRHGKLVTVKYLLRRVNLRGKRNIVIVGVRSKAELDYLRKRAKIVTVAVVAPVRLRFKRIKKRGRPDTPRTLAKFIRDRDKKEARWGELRAIRSADYIIAGTGTIPQLRREIEKILELEQYD